MTSEQSAVKTNEEKWREEFEIEQWPSIERNWSFPLGDHHKKLVKETALNIYLAAREKAEKETFEEIQSSPVRRCPMCNSGELLALARKKITSLKQQLKEKDEEIANYRGTGIKLLEIEKSNTILKEELRCERDSINKIHSWYNKHRKDDGEFAFSMCETAQSLRKVIL